MASIIRHLQEISLNLLIQIFVTREKKFNHIILHWLPEPIFPTIRPRA